MTPSLKLTHVHFSVDDHGVATVLIDVQGERMNTLSPKLDTDLSTVQERIEADSGIRAVVYGSAKDDNFVAGANIDSIGEVRSAARASELSKKLQDAFNRLEKLHTERGKPLVFAIHGPCLGGGLELALTGSYRICSDSPKTKIGLPEVQLGLLPGAGGTQRLPRLVGIATALDLMLTGRHLRPRKAKKVGLVDEVVPKSILLDIARQRAREAADGKLEPRPTGLARFKDIGDPDFLQQLALEENPVGRRILFKKAREKLLEKTRGNYPAPERILDVVRVGADKGFEAGLAAEAEAFGELLVTPVAGSLMSIFFATQEMKKENGTDDPEAQARPVSKVGVLGGGLMGGGIAAVSALRAKVPARIKEIDDAGVRRGLKYTRKMLDKDVKRRRRSKIEANQLMHRVTGTTTWDGLANAEVVVEAVFEDLGLKRRVLREFEENCPKDAIFASNTSTIPISIIAAEAKHPERVIGMHYFSPVEKMPLLEIIVTDKTDDDVTATCVELGRAQGKTVIVVNDGHGFYTSRILGPYMTEALWLLEEGASIQALDDALVDFGFPVGPVVLYDEVGIDVAHKIAKVARKEFDITTEAPDTLDKLVADGRHGRKTQKGFYRYEDGKKKGVDESVYEAIGQSRDREKLPIEEMQQRCVLQMLNEAARCLEEGILRNTRDGDIGAIFGLGFPPFLGGPFRYLDQLGAGEVVRRLDRYGDQHGERFKPAAILLEYAKSGKKFRS